MPHVIDCPKCRKRYQVADTRLGKQVRCQQCGTEFTIPPGTTSAVPAQLADTHSQDSLADLDLSQFAATSASGSLYSGSNPLGTTAHSALGNFASAGPRSASVSNPSGGPTDVGMRLGACGMLGFAMLLTLVSVVIHAFTGTVYMIVIGLVPFLFGLGITALISPNVVRAMGQFGGHLPKYYKFIGWGIAGFSILLMFPIMVVLYQSGFRSTSTPRPRPRFRQVTPASPAQAAPVPARQIAANNNAAGGQDKLNVVKPKSYPVSIAIPDHSVAVPQKAKLAPGTRLQACYFDKWNPITLLSENEDGTLNVRWDDWGEKFDCTMIRRELIIRKDVLNPSLKPPSSVASQPASAKDAGSVDSKPAQKPLKAYPITIAVPPDHQFVPDGAKLQPGTRLQACYAGKWNPITFLSENQDGTLTVRWDDYGPVYDCSMIRNELIIAKNGLR